MIEKIHLIHHTHYDIGFTDLPDEVERQQLSYLDEAIRLGESDPEYCWTIESGMLLRNYLESRPESMKERLLNLLRKEQFEVAAFDMQMLTETASFPELLENVMRPVRLGKKYGFPVNCAILDDIGGFAGELPRIMNEAGIRYLIAGCGAFQTELPWADLPHLFYLKSKIGGKILVWNLGNDRQEVSWKSVYAYPVYGMGSHFLGYRSFPEFFGIPDLGVKTTVPGDTEDHKLSSAEVFQIFLDRLEREKYPYSELLLQYGGDNRNPSPKMAELVRVLNDSGNYPEIKLVTPTTFFREMEVKYGDQIPEISGILTDPWNIRINAVPSVLKNYRSAQRKYDSLRLQGIYDDSVLENLMLVADHTLGLNTWGWQNAADKNNKSLRIKEFDRFRESWKCKASYADYAMRKAQRISRNLACDTQQDETPAIVVRNSSPHIISGSVEIYLGSYARRLISLKDSAGNEIPRQLIGQNRWMLFVKSVPALGSVRLTPVFSELYDETPEVLEQQVPNTLSSEYFILDFSANGSLRSIKDPTGSVLMGDSNIGSGEILCETHFDSGVGGEDCGLRPSIERKLETISEQNSKITADGELFTEILQTGHFSGGKTERFIRLWKHQPRIDFAFRLDLPESYEKKCWYAAFPFAGNQGRFQIDQNVGTFSPDELLPGSMLDLFFCSRYTALETERFSAVLCCPDSPVVEFSGMHTAKWRKELPLQFENNHIYGLLYNNICNTDAPSWQQILDTFHYSLFLQPQTLEPAFAHESWFSVSALEAEVSFESEKTDCSGIPLGLRLHSDYEGKLYLENPGKDTVDYNFTIRGKNYSGSIQPKVLEKISGI